MRFEPVAIAVVLAATVPGFGGAQELPQETSKIRLAGGVSRLGQLVELDRDAVVDINSSVQSLFDRSTDGVEGWGQLAQFPDAASHNAEAAIDGDTLVIHGFVDDDPELALVYERDEGGVDAWGLVATLIASDRSNLDEFADAIAISGDTILIGAPKNNSDENVVNTGGAYIFQRDHGGPGAWGEVARLLAPDAAQEDRFGNWVAIDGDTVVVLAPRHDGHDGTSNKGAFYVYERDHGGPDAWGFVTESIPPLGVKLNSTSIQLSGDTLVASQFVFERDHGGPDTWEMFTELAPSDPQPGASFGSSNILGDTIAISAPLYDVGELENAGAAYVFQRGESGEWSELGKITASDAEADAWFGGPLDLSLTTLAVGAGFDGGMDPGAIYTFEFPAPVGGTVWGVTPNRVQCRNLTQAQAFEAPLTELSWDCEALGLVVASGDRVSMRVVGAATGTEPIGGTVVGQINRRLTCENRELLQEIKSVMNGATTWNCETEGMDVMAGDTVHQVVLGIKR